MKLTEDELDIKANISSFVCSRVLSHEGKVEAIMSLISGIPSKCERCGAEFQAYCAKCRDEIRNEQMPAVPSEDLAFLLAYDRKTEMYRFGCSVKGCPCNLQNGWCSKAVPVDFWDLVKTRLHAYDGDNCVKQFCG